MNLASGRLFRTLNLVTIRLAAALVPRGERAEWWNEWESELWHVREAYARKYGKSWHAEREVSAFCFGAFQDALCLRQRSSLALVPQHHPGSAAHCILSLAGLAAAAYCIAMFLPGARIAAEPSPYRNARALILVSSAGYSEASVPTIQADQFRVWRKTKQHLFSSFAFYQPITKFVTIEPHHLIELSVARSSPNLFDILGLPIQMNSPGNAADGNLPKMVVTDNVWRKYFGEGQHLSGGIVKVGLRRVKIIGVVPAQQWSLPGNFDAWLLEPDEDAPAILSTAKGFVVAHLEPSPEHQQLSDHWNMSAPSISGNAEDFSCDSVWARTREPYSIFVFTVILAFLALPATTSLPLGDYPAAPHKLSRSKRFRRWAFLAAKLALILPVIYFGSIDLAHFDPAMSDSSSQYIQIVTSFCGCLFALRWMLKDQRKRCPVCLGRLSNPARVGEPSRNFLAWNGTELMCVGGHGLLHVPEIATSWFSTQRWLYLDPSWDVLFF